MTDTHKRAIAVAASAAVGYFAVDRLYRYARTRGGTADKNENDWVCPGVGVGGGLVGAGIAGYMMCGGDSKVSSGGCPMAASSVRGDTPRLDLPSFSLSN